MPPILCYMSSFIFRWLKLTWFVELIEWEQMKKMHFDPLRDCVSGSEWKTWLQINFRSLQFKSWEQ